MGAGRLVRPLRMSRARLPPGTQHATIGEHAGRRRLPATRTSVRRHAESVTDKVVRGLAALAGFTPPCGRSSATRAASRAPGTRGRWARDRGQAAHDAPTRLLVGDPAVCLTRRAIGRGVHVDLPGPAGSAVRFRRLTTGARGMRRRPRHPRLADAVARHPERQGKGWARWPGLDVTPQVGKLVSGARRERRGPGRRRASSPAARTAAHPTTALGARLAVRRRP